MNDKMIPIPFDRLVEWIFSEYRNEQAIFGIPAEKFFRKTNSALYTISGKTVENPIGPAAGPHTQLTQNIVSAYLAGARYFELKTVQILDGEDLPVSKPCILARDEGYNVEWSTELTVPAAFDEYVKAYFILSILSKELQLGSNTGFAFNMSVGYDLQGIQSPKIDAFIENLKDASKTPVWKDCKDYLQAHLDIFSSIDSAYVEALSPNVCSSITLSTLHGCPRLEIEKIADYLLNQKRLNVYIKCNPTLLGYDFARKTLDDMGFAYLSFDDHHFKEDLQFEDAIPMLKRLQSTAKELQLDFGVKLTNTFPVEIKRQELPGEEMYMSGRALHPLTVNLAARLAEAMGSELRISYSGGADFFNLGDILETGIWPVTFATTLLKPGGYSRIKQLADCVEQRAVPSAASGVSIQKLRTLAERVVKEALYQKEFKETETRKIPKSVPLMDCFIAPCKQGCPIGQDAPEYIRLNDGGRYQEAFELITSKNPFPFTTGTICSHMCMKKCTRMDYDKPVDIRAAKISVAEKAYALAGNQTPEAAEKTPVENGCKVAVIGAGPAGLSAGYFLARNGMDVTVFEKRESIGGILTHIIPDFRLPNDALARDLALIKNSGVTFRLGVAAGFSIDALKKDGYKYIFVATGAWKPGHAGFKTDGKNVVDVLQFLESFKSGGAGIKSGKNIVVIGAGNSAMDAARAAKRIPGVENVHIIYRRTKKLIPADREELNLALEDGVVFKELLSPLSFEDGVLLCQRMVLGEPDASGRRSPVPSDGQFEEITADLVITAVGQKTDDALLLQNNISLGKNGKLKIDPQTNETSIDNVFAGGDLSRGPATVVEAIADGLKFAEIVLGREGITPKVYELSGLADKTQQYDEIAAKKGVLERSCRGVSGKCLECNTVCNICVEVCPNRANVAIKVKGLKNINQVLHIDSMCNACGNCEAFCPYESAPYKDKLTLYSNAGDFDAGENQGFWFSDINSGSVKARMGNKTIEGRLDAQGNCDGLPSEIADIVRTVFLEYPYIV